MALHRRSWTTKPDKALVCESLEQADLLARAMLPLDQYRHMHLTYAHSQGGFVIFNEAGTKMVADR
jgi:hypothetical protein